MVFFLQHLHINSAFETEQTNVMINEEDAVPTHKTKYSSLTHLKSWMYFHSMILKLRAWFKNKKLLKLNTKKNTLLIDWLIIDFSLSLLNSLNPFLKYG